MPPTGPFKWKEPRQFYLVDCSFSDDFPTTGFRARIVDVIAHCCGKLTQADICQCKGDLNTYSYQLHKRFFVVFSMT